MPEAQGEELVGFLKHVLFELPHLMPAGDKVVNMVPVKLGAAKQAFLYGIGPPPKAQPDAAHRQLIMRPQFAPGTDYDEVRRQLAAGHKGVVPDPTKKRYPATTLARAVRDEAPGAGAGPDPHDRRRQRAARAGRGPRAARALR
jgi:hypothetical protein